MDDEQAQLQLIDERDAAEAAVSQAYFIVTGRPAEWSNKFGYKQALEEIDQTIKDLKRRTDVSRCVADEM